MLPLLKAHVEYVGGIYRATCSDLPGLVGTHELSEEAAARELRLRLLSVIAKGYSKR